MSHDDKVSRYLASNPCTSARDVSDATGIPMRTTMLVLRALKAKGVVRYRSNPSGWLLVGPSESSIVTQSMLRTAQAKERVTAGELADAVAQWRSGEAAFQAADELVKAGLLSRRRGGYYSITALGIDMLPKPAPVYVMTPYRPPKAPPRRPGSMAHLTLPSVYSGAPV